MNIAIDYDDTYTKDPILWDSFINTCIDKGYYVAIVTMRHPWEAIERNTYDIPVYYTGRKGKKYFCRETDDREFDIWIDDHPEYVLVDHVELQLRQLTQDLSDLVK